MAEAGESNRAEQLRKQIAKTRALKAQGVNFVVEDSSLTGDKIIKAVKDGKSIGQMALKPPSDRTNFKGAREIRMVRVEPDAQRKGVATSLFNEARKLGLKPIHSQRLTDEGKAYSAAQGGQRIPEKDISTNPKSIKITKERNQQMGKERAKQIALEKQMAKVQGRTYTEPQARLRPGVNFGGTFNKGLGVLGFLPTLLEAGKIATGRSRMVIPGSDPTIGQMR
jgi:N-acetylglutamate synthase-like GNAT family acetyltransferase